MCSMYICIFIRLFSRDILGKYEAVENFKEKLYSFRNFDSVTVEFKEN